MNRPLPAGRPGRPDAPGDPPAWHEIAPFLWVGDGRFPPEDRFDVVVTLDATVGSAQPPTGGRHVVVAMRDTRWEPIDRSALATAVTHVVAALHDGHRVLVRCEQGLNRAPLVAGEALAALGTPREELVDLLRHRRDPRVLTNPRFADQIRLGGGPGTNRDERWGLHSPSTSHE